MEDWILDGVWIELIVNYFYELFEMVKNEDYIMLVLMFYHVIYMIDNFANLVHGLGFGLEDF